MKKDKYFVVDTNVFISALLIEHSKSWETVSRIIQEGFFLFSRDVLDELIEVISRPKFDKYVSLQDRYEYLDLIIDGSVYVKTTKEIIACRDPRDNKILELAVSGRADSIITGDKDLLSLNPFQGIPILTPNEFSLLSSVK